MLLQGLSKLWRLARTENSHIQNDNIFHKAPVSRSVFWSDNPRGWGIVPLSYYGPNWTDMFEERKTMTDEQKKKIEEMPDLKVLIELAISFGNTENASLRPCHRRNIMEVFEGLNVDHIDDCPHSAKEKEGS